MEVKGGVGVWFIGVLGVVIFLIVFLVFVKWLDIEIILIDWLFFVLVLVFLLFWYVIVDLLWVVIVLIVVDLFGFGLMFCKVYVFLYDENILFFMLFMIRNFFVFIVLE